MRTHRRIHCDLRVEELEQRLAPAMTMTMVPTDDSGILSFDQITNNVMPMYILEVEDDGDLYIDWKGDEDDPTMAYPDAEDADWWGVSVSSGTQYFIPQPKPRGPRAQAVSRDPKWYERLTYNWSWSGTNTGTRGPTDKTILSLIHI